MEKIFLISLLSTVCYLPLFANAQINFGSQFNLNNVVSLPDELSIDISPEYPRPNSSVILSLRMYTEDLDSALITWFKDGKKEREGVGLKNFTFVTGPSGSQTEVTVNINLVRGLSFSKKITLRSANVDILWQANSHVPPFYRGKALFPKQGSVTLSAVHNFYSGTSRINPNQLVYTWTVNDRVLESQSGYGKHTVSTDGPILGTSLNVSLLVTDPKTNIVASNSVNISPVEPIITFYENSPLYGIIFEHSVNGGLQITGEEVNIIAVPYYMNTDSLSYSWRMNGRATPEVSGLSVTFRKPETVSGSTSLSLRAENLNRILQFAENSFTIKYSD